MRRCHAPTAALNVHTHLVDIAMSQPLLAASPQHSKARAPASAPVNRAHLSVSSAPDHCGKLQSTDGAPTLQSSEARPWTARLRAAWNVSNNFRSLYRRREGSFKALDGLRALALLWVMVYHGMTFTHGPDALEDAWQWNIIRTGELGVDMFFVLSGFLIHHLLSKEFEETGRINYFRFLARRWLRLWPAYVVIFPLYLINAQSRAECERWWWTNLLMINNYVGPGAETGGCMGHTWSIAVEFQFYCVSPLLVWMMHSRQCPLLKGRWPTLIPVGIALMSALVRAVLYVYDINHISEMLDQDDIQTGGAEIYAPMYTRLGPYAVGMVTSYLFQQWKQAQQQLPNSYVPMSAITNTNGRGCTLSCVHIAHVLAFLVWATLSLIGPKPVWGADFRAPLPGQDPVWSQALAVVYVAFSRTSFGVAVAWGIYSCLTGKAFFLNKLLSAKAFAPIARLSYSTYLVQFAGVKPAEAVFKTAIAAISTPTAALPVLLGIWSMTFAIAFPLAFCVYMAAERPMMKLRPV